jgi:hypothetical protein
MSFKQAALTVLIALVVAFIMNTFVPPPSPARAEIGGGATVSGTSAWVFNGSTAWFCTILSSGANSNTSVIQPKPTCVPIVYNPSGGPAYDATIPGAPTSSK